MRWLLLSAALAFGIDQGSKWWVFGPLDLWNVGNLEVLPPFLVFKPGLNTGINFGLFGEGGQGARIFLIVLAVIISCALVWWAWRSFERSREYVSAGWVIGGALGNALDRVLYPGVLDFLNMSCCGFSNPYIFNLADVFIFAGAFGLILWTGDSKKEA